MNNRRQLKKLRARQVRLNKQYCILRYHERRVGPTQHILDKMGHNTELYINANTLRTIIYNNVIREFQTVVSKRATS